jgi:hypothetical protein
MTGRLRCLWIASLCSAAVGMAPAWAQTAPSRIVRPIDEAQRVSLGGNVHPLAQARFDQGPAPLSLPTGRMALVLRRSAAQQQALDQFLEDVQNPSSPDYHHWLTPAQYGARFGPSDSDLQSVEAWLQAEGFQIDKVPPARNFLQFSGNIEQVQTAFHTAIHAFALDGASHFANVTDPEIPAALAPVVAGITPLNDFHPRPDFQRAASRREGPANGGPDLTLFNRLGSHLFLDPADAATIYDAPNAFLNPAYSGTTWDGSGVAIGIVGVSDLAIADVQNYRAMFLGEQAADMNLPIVVVDGEDPGLVPGAAADEELLDNEIAGALAPKATLYDYIAGDSALSSGLMNAYLRALNDNRVSILNISFSGCEAEEGSGGNQALLEAAMQAAAQGISVTVSTGDGGAAGCDDFNSSTQAQHGFGVNGIASTPYTIAVGGTDFDGVASNFSTYVSTAGPGTPPYYRTVDGYIPEKPWNETSVVNNSLANNVDSLNGIGESNIIAGGGGSSSCATANSGGKCLGGYAKPAFQASVTPNDHVRDLPDVSLFASNGFDGAAWVFCSDNVTDGSAGNPYTDCRTTGGQLTADTTFSGVGGTSASAPAFAGMLALVSQSLGGARLGQADTVLYPLAQTSPSVFHDIANGNNAVPCEPGSANCGSNGFLTGYNAAAGYDLASGLGSIDVAALIRSWNSVSLAPTSTVLTIDGSAGSYIGTHGSSLLFDTAVQTGAGGAVPTGLVSISGSGGTQFTIPLNDASGSALWNGLSGGSYTVSARYSGDSEHAASTSSPISVTIAPETSTTTLSVIAASPLTGALLPSLSEIPYGSAVVLDAQITGAAEGARTQGTATGTVTYSDGGTTLGTGNVGSGNIASWSPSGSALTALPPGRHTIGARYSGDGSFDPSASSSVAMTVVQAATSISATLHSSSVSGSGSSAMTVTLTTPANLGAQPTGSIVVKTGGTLLGTIPVNSWVQGSGPSAVDAFNGTVALSGLALAPNNVFVVTYSGDRNYAGSGTTIRLGKSGAAGIDSGTPSIFLSSGGNLTLHAGATSDNTTSITVTPYGGFTGQVRLGCTVAASSSTASALPSCSIPPGVTLAESAATVSLSVVTTTGPANAQLHGPGSPPFLFSGAGAAFALLLFFGVPARKRAWGALLGVLAAAILVSTMGCGVIAGTKPVQSTNTTNSGTAPGGYIITVTGTDAASGTITASTSLTVTVD